MTNAPLHLIIAGAPKAGTTSLYEYLGAHPDVGASHRKNTHFFTDPDFNFEGRELAHARAAENGLTSYRDHFPPEPKDVLVEATATYFTSLGTARRIRDGLDNVKVIVMLRDPAERFASAWRVHLQAGVVEPSTTLADYLEMQYRDLEQMRLSITRQALMTGHYASILERYYDAFDAEDMLLLRFTALKDPRTLMHQICNFAGLDPTFYDTYAFEQLNASNTIRNQSVFFGARRALSTIRRHPFMRARFVSNTVDVALNTVGRPLYRRVMYRSTPSSHDEDVMGELRDYYSDEAEELYRLTGQRGLLD